METEEGRRGKRVDKRKRAWESRDPEDGNPVWLSSQGKIC